MCKVSTFLGIHGVFPSPANDMAIALSPSPDKSRARADRIRQLLDLGDIARQELESLIGKLSFSQAPIFGRFGRPMMAPLNGHLGSPNFHPLLPDRGRRGLQRWVVTLPDLRRSPAFGRAAQAGRADLTIFTDAATSPVKIAAVIPERPLFVRERAVAAIKSELCGPNWGNLFGETDMIYGTKTIAPLAPHMGAK